MSEAPKDPADKEYRVLAHFRDARGRESVTYDPKGDRGWPGAKDVYVGNPDSRVVKDLLEGAGGVHGPLIAEKDPDEEKSEDKPETAASRSRTTTPASGVAGKES